MRDAKLEKKFFDLLEEISLYWDGEIPENKIKAKVRLFEAHARQSSDVFEDYIYEIKELIK